MGIEFQTVKTAYSKATAGQELTKAETAALRRYEKEKERRLRAKYYRSTPRKDWSRMSGRQTQVINEQATRYGHPVRRSRHRPVRGCKGHP